MLLGIKQNGNVISRFTEQHITKEDLQDPKMKENLASFDNIIKEKISDEKHESLPWTENKFFHEDIIIEKEE